MTDDDKPQRGVHVRGGFGEGSAGAPPRARDGAGVRFRLVIVGDFGGTGDGRLRDISGEDLPGLLASFGSSVAMEVSNRLSASPPALAIRLPIASVRDLDPKTIGARIPEISAFEAQPAGRAAAVPAAGAPAVAAEDDGSLDRLLGMVDTPAATTPPEDARAAISALLSAAARPRAAAPAPKGARPQVQAQVREIAAHPAWLAAEAAWRSLRLILAARASRAATRLALDDVPRERIVEELESEAFGKALGAEPDMTAVLVLGAFGRSTRDLEALDRLAIAADRLGVPVIVSLAQDFLGAPPEQVGRMDNPRSLLEAPAYAAWRGLRGRDESRSLFAAWNDVVLRQPAGEAPILWGEPGVLLAAQILRSLARTGWPTEIVGMDSAIDGLEVTEAEARGGRTVAIPLRALIDTGAARDLAEEGILCLVCRPDRDQAWFTRAASVHALGRTPEVDRTVMEGFNSLPFRFVSVFFENLLHENSALFSGGLQDDEIATGMTRLLNDVLLTTGPGAAAHVSSSGDRQFEVSIRLGRSVMDGFSFSSEIAL